jgi:hypothetical protein
MACHLRQLAHSEKLYPSISEVMLTTPTLADCALHVGKKKFLASQVYLAAASPFLKQLLLDSGDNRATLLLPDTSFLHLRTLLQYLYQGILPQEPGHKDGLLEVASYLGIDLGFPGFPPADPDLDSAGERSSLSRPRQPAEVTQVADSALTDQLLMEPDTISLPPPPRNLYWSEEQLVSALTEYWTGAETAKRTAERHQIPLAAFYKFTCRRSGKRKFAMLYSRCQQEKRRAAVRLLSPPSPHLLFANYLQNTGPTDYQSTFYRRFREMAGEERAGQAEQAELRQSPGGAQAELRRSSGGAQAELRRSSGGAQTEQAELREEYRQHSFYWDIARMRRTD